MRRSTIAVLVLLLATAGSARSASKPGPTTRFLEQAAARSLAGLELSDLALQRSQSAAVRRLARRTHDEQAHAYEALLGLATGPGTNAAPSDTLDLEHRGIKSRLATLQGADFDRAYIAALRVDEDRDIALYRGYAHSGKDTALKDWAGEQLQAIRRRRQLIEAAALEIR